MSTPPVGIDIQPAWQRRQSDSELFGPAMTTGQARQQLLDGGMKATDAMRLKPKASPKESELEQENTWLKRRLADASTASS
jgi:hypothetical protein